MNQAQQLVHEVQHVSPDTPPLHPRLKLLRSLRLPYPFPSGQRKQTRGLLLRGALRLAWEVKNLPGLRAWLQRAIGAFLVLPVNLWVVEHWRRWILSWWHLAERFLIGLQQCKDHGNHLPGDPSEHFLFPSILLHAFVIGCHTWE